MGKAGDGDRIARAVAARLPSGAVVKVETADAGSEGSGDGITSVGLKELHLSDALEPVGEIGELVWKQVGKAMPSKATVELKLGFTVESGKLTALWVGGKGEAALTVTLEWSGRSGEREPGNGDANAADKE
jgi:hypothetical protein